MKVFFATLVFFLIAFAGLSIGLLLKRASLRGGCRSNAESTYKCRCDTEKKKRLHNFNEKADEDHSRPFER